VISKTNRLLPKRGEMHGSARCKACCVQPFEGRKIRRQTAVGPLASGQLCEMKQWLSRSFRKQP